MSVQKRTVLDRAREAAGLAWWRGVAYREALEDLMRMEVDTLEVRHPFAAFSDGRPNLRAQQHGTRFTWAPEWPACRRAAERAQARADALTLADWRAWCADRRPKRQERKEAQRARRAAAQQRADEDRRSLERWETWKRAHSGY